MPILDKIIAIYTEYGLQKARKINLGLSGEAVKKQLIMGVEYAYLAGVKGDIVEFGTQTGRTAKILSFAINMNRKLEKCIFPKNLLLFDSFEGLPEIKSDIDKSHPFVKPNGWHKGTLKGLNPKALLKVVREGGLDSSRIKIYAGWFNETIDTLPDDTKLALLHIDSDLYQSAIDVLDGCFSKGFISEGAIIFFDDWNLASPRFGERRAWREMVEKYNVEYSDEGGYAWNAHKFIVHSYKRGIDATYKR